ncbi:kinase-like domain-containing protein [Mycena capillaripes]|nr:kinase-like domain-containing protein [Mycena capillaripes]
MGQQLSAGYAAFSDGVPSDLRVYVANNDASNAIVAEDKRGLVWAEHEPALLSLLAQETVPVVGPAENPPPAVRICYQINTQMHKYNVFYAKLFSPCGVFYIRRDAGARFLQFSKVYRELDGEVHRTACLIIEALNHPDGVHLTPVLSVSGLSARLSATWPTRAILGWIRRRALQLFLNMSAICGAPTIAIGPDNYWSLFHPVYRSPPFSSGIFDEFIGAGASGNVWRSTDGRHVIKVFTDTCRAQAEAKVLASCADFPGLAVPTFCGLFTDGRQYGIVTPYVGKAIEATSGADASQRVQLVQVLRRLHKHGIHHHDVRPENVMVNDAGAVTLIDFDRAQWVDGPCPNCIDSELIASMERETKTMDDPGRCLYDPGSFLEDPITSYL